jgi:hypothetical protein
MPIGVLDFSTTETYKSLQSMNPVNWPRTCSKLYSTLVEHGDYEAAERMLASYIPNKRPLTEGQLERLSTCEKEGLHVDKRFGIVVYKPSEKTTEALMKVLEKENFSVPATIVSDHSFIHLTPNGEVELEFFEGERYLESLPKVGRERILDALREQITSVFTYTPESPKADKLIEQLNKLDERVEKLQDLFVGKYHSAVERLHEDALQEAGRRKIGESVNTMNKFFEQDQGNFDYTRFFPKLRTTYTQASLPMLANEPENKQYDGESFEEQLEASTGLVFHESRNGFGRITKRVIATTDKLVRTFDGAPEINTDIYEDDLHPYNALMEDIKNKKGLSKLDPADLLIRAMGPDPARAKKAWGLLEYLDDGTLRLWASPETVLKHLESLKRKVRSGKVKLERNGLLSISELKEAIISGEYVLPKKKLDSDSLTTEIERKGKDYYATLVGDETGYVSITSRRIMQLFEENQDDFPRYRTKSKELSRIEGEDLFGRSFKHALNQFRTKAERRLFMNATLYGYESAEDDKSFLRRLGAWANRYKSELSAAGLLGLIGGITCGAIFIPKVEPDKILKGIKLVFENGEIKVAHGLTNDPNTIYVQESEVPIVIDGNITEKEWGKTQEIKYGELGIQTAKQEGFFRVQFHNNRLVVAGELLTDTTPQSDDSFGISLKTGANPKQVVDYAITIICDGSEGYHIAHIPKTLPFVELVRGAAKFSKSFAHTEEDHRTYETGVPFELLSFRLEEEPSTVLFATSLKDTSKPVVINSTIANFLVWPTPHPSLAKIIFPHKIPEFNSLQPLELAAIALTATKTVLLAQRASKRKKNN